MMEYVKGIIRVALAVWLTGLLTFGPCRADVGEDGFFSTSAGPSYLRWYSNWQLQTGIGSTTYADPAYTSGNDGISIGLALSSASSDDFSSTDTAIGSLGASNYWTWALGLVSSYYMITQASNTEDSNDSKSTPVNTPEPSIIFAVCALLAPTYFLRRARRARRHV
jgi:hypothetical protein